MVSTRVAFGRTADTGGENGGQRRRVIAVRPRVADLLVEHWEVGLALRPQQRLGHIIEAATVDLSVRELGLLKQRRESGLNHRMF